MCTFHVTHALLMETMLEICFFFFFWTSQLHMSQAFWQCQAQQILTLYEHVMNLCSKWILYFFEELLKISYLTSYGQKKVHK
jgi:hypothetical protein